LKTITISVLAILLATGTQFLPSKPLINIHDRYVNKIEYEKLQTYGAVEFTHLEKIPTTCADYRHLVDQYDWDKRIAAAVMKAESNCNTEAVGDTWVIGGIYAPSCGLMQIRTLSGRPDCETLKNASVNLEWAYKLYKANGWQPWSVYKNGKYLQYM
jgi:hypothetical protein